MDWPFLLALAILLIALAVYGYRARAESPVNRWFALQTLTLVLWIIGIAGTHAGHHPEFWGRWTFASACLMPAAFFGFTCVFPDDGRPRSARALPIVVTLALGFAALSAFTPFVAHSFVITSSGLRRAAGPLMPLFSLYFLLSTVLVLALLIGKWRRATGQARAQLRFYNTGLLTLCIGAITTNLVLPALTGHSEYSTVGPYFVLPLVALIGHAIIRHRLFDLRLMIHRGAAFLIFIGLASASILLILSQAGVDVWIHHVTIPLATILVVAVAGVSLSLPLAPRLARVMDNYLLRGRTDLDRALQETARRLARLLTTEGISLEIESSLRATLAVDRVVVLTGEAHSSRLDPAVQTAARAIGLPRPSVLLLSREGGPTATLYSSVLRKHGFEVWVGLGRGAGQTGIILLGEQHGGEAYLAPTLQFIEDIAELSSLAFEVAFLHRRQIDLEREKQRLEHFARMGRAYAGLGHEIRTPLTTISNLVALIPDRLDDAEFRDVVTRLIPREVGRIVRLTEQLRLMAPGDNATLVAVDLRALLADIAAMRAAAGETFFAQLDVPDVLPTIRGDRAQLVQLFINLLTNAIEAMPHGGDVVIRLQRGTASSGQHVLNVEVIDEGVGIPNSASERVFEPFFTTKPSGTGLGLSICREIADFHGASLTVSSRNDRTGTVARVQFPIPDDLNRSIDDRQATAMKSTFS
ncbi:MAG: hypothetical protein FJ027_06680 [Candidatus Rokubacteria bacterium]|nr:hypothetical protein [Candidatus Rokubacteria bacterium]